MIDLSFTEKASRMQNTPQGNLEWRLSEDSLPVCLLQTRERVTETLAAALIWWSLAQWPDNRWKWTSRHSFDRAVGVYRREWFRFSKTKSPHILYTWTLSLYILDKSQRSFFSKSRQSSVQWWERGTALGKTSTGRVPHPRASVQQRRQFKKQLQESIFK